MPTHHAATITAAAV
jgi:hypothetical protein